MNSHQVRLLLCIQTTVELCVRLYVCGLGASLLPEGCAHTKCIEGVGLHAQCKPAARPLHPPQLETCVLKRLLLGCLLNVEPEVASWVEIEAAKNRILGLLLNECIMRSYAEQVQTLVSKNRDSPPI